MRKHRSTITRVKRLSLCALGALAAAAPTASADTGDPVFTCRGSAGYTELEQLPRVEPVSANAVAPSAANPDGDTAQCANDRGGLPSAVLPPGANPGVQVTLQSLVAETSITPEIGAARTQTANSSAATALDPLALTVGGQQFTIRADALTSSARATCVNGAPVLTGTSLVTRLTINGTVVDIPTNQDNFVVDQLQPLLRIVANEQVTTTNAAGDRTLVRRALHIQVLGVAPAPPVANIVLAESRVGTRGAVCAPPPPPPTCPAGSVPQPGNPLVCVVTQTALCPAGSTPDPNAGGACVIVRVTPSGPCPQGSIDDPNSNNCLFIVQRPCPAAARPDPATRVCVVTTGGSGGNTNGGGNTSGSNGANGSNGGIGSANGPRVTCGRLSLRFVRNGRQTLTSRAGQRLVTRGRLVTCGSNPRSIVGARINVVHVLPGGKRLTKTGLRSRPGGALTLILPNNLRSRKIEFSYRPDLTKQRVSSRVNLRLTVRNRKGRILR